MKHFEIEIDGINILIKPLNNTHEVNLSMMSLEDSLSISNELLNYEEGQITLNSIKCSWTRTDR